MSNWIDRNGLQDHRLPTENLKCCPLCGVLNAVQNGECFVCGWRGQFDHDPELIEECLYELLERCPELAGAIAEPMAHAPRSWWSRVADKVRRALWRRSLDLRV
ncbi:MAG: hypothetical protein M9921_08455 [Fimbriimonadaceae bacterium]|nr:hypothetical protein [Fimbriimonadaceae bacterium]